MYKRDLVKTGLVCPEWHCGSERDSQGALVKSSEPASVLGGWALEVGCGWAEAVQGVRNYNVNLDLSLSVGEGGVTEESKHCIWLQ